MSLKNASPVPLPDLVARETTIPSLCFQCPTSLTEAKSSVRHSQKPWGPRGENYFQRHYMNQNNAWHFMVYMCKPQRELDLVPVWHQEPWGVGTCLTGLGWRPDLSHLPISHFQYSHQSQFQVTEAMSLNMELGRDACNWLVQAGTGSSTLLSLNQIFLSQDPSYKGSHRIISANEDIMFYCWLLPPFKFIHL